MLRSKLSDLLVSAGLSLMPKPAPLPRALGLLGFASVAIWLYGLVKVTDRDRAKLHEVALASEAMGMNVDQLNALLAEPNVGETFGAFKVRCPGAKLARGIWPVSDDASWNGAIFVQELEREIAHHDKCPQNPRNARNVDPYGLGRSLSAARKMLAEGGRNFRSWHELLSPFGASCAFEPGEDVREAVLSILRDEGWTVQAEPTGDHGTGIAIRVSRQYTQCDIADALNYNATVGG